MGKTKLLVIMVITDCTFTVSDYEFGFIFLQWALTSFHGKNIKV